jgi:hypothetical protein
MNQRESFTSELLSWSAPVILTFLALGILVYLT